MVLFPAAGGIAILAIKFSESIELSKPEEKRLVGKRCLVIIRVSPEQRGVVKVYNGESYLDPETWSAESAYGEVIEEGKVAKVVGMRSIILEVEEDSSTEGKSDSSRSTKFGC
ncbi:MAG: NfeD family protein [Nitrososphaerales archaeon]